MGDATVLFQGLGDCRYDVAISISNLQVGN